MFGIDIETFNTLWPSLLIVALMIGAMGWGIAKVTKLMSENNPQNTNASRHAH